MTSHKFKFQIRSLKINYKLVRTLFLNRNLKQTNLVDQKI